MTRTVKIEGLREVEKAMEELGRAASTAAGRKALLEGGEILARSMRNLAPKDEGHLIESIDVGTKLTRRQRSLHRRESPVEVFVGANDPAAVTQEFGTVDHAPQPFARPAWDETQDDVLKRVGDVLMVEVEKRVKRARAKAAKLAAKG